LLRKKDAKAVSSKVQVPPLLLQRHNTNQLEILTGTPYRQ